MFIRFLHHRHRCSDWPTGRLVLAAWRHRSFLLRCSAPRSSEPTQMQRRLLRMRPARLWRWLWEATAHEHPLASQSSWGTVRISWTDASGSICHRGRRKVKKPSHKTLDQVNDIRIRWLFSGLPKNDVWSRPKLIHSIFISCNAIGPAYGRNRWNLCLFRWLHQAYQLV